MSLELGNVKGAAYARWSGRAEQPVDKIGCRTQRHNMLGRKAPMRRSMLRLPWVAAFYQRAGEPHLLREGGRGGEGYSR